MATFRNTLRESDLHEMLLHNSLDLYYQPRVDLRNGQITGMEAQVRWPLFDNSTLSPKRFLDITKDDRILLAMSERILHKACSENARWADMGHSLRLAVSLSYRQLAHQDFPNQVADILEDTGLPANQLELELTESMLLYSMERSSASTLERLRTLGVHLSISDFGKGYLSLTALRHSLVDTLKIHPSFTAGIGLNPDDDAIISAIVAIASNLDLTSIAVGVEIKEQVQFLRREGCDQMQGRFHSQPMPVDAFSETLELYRLLDKTRSAAAELSAKVRRFHA